MNQHQRAAVQWVGFGAAGAAAGLAPASTQAEVVYTPLDVNVPSEVAPYHVDLNSDGIPDLWSYFENGRLVRRDVSAVGLEILSQREQLPAPSAEFSQVSVPGD